MAHLDHLKCMASPRGVSGLRARGVDRRAVRDGVDFSPSKPRVPENTDLVPMARADSYERASERALAKYIFFVCIISHFQTRDKATTGVLGRHHCLPENLARHKHAKGGQNKLRWVPTWHLRARAPKANSSKNMIMMPPTTMSSEMSGGLCCTPRVEWMAAC